MQQGQPWTQEHLAVKARISLSYVSLIERGRRIPPMHTLTAIADALDVPVTELLSRLEPRLNSTSEAVRPLTTFIQRRGLGPDEVYSLLRVAKLMFNREKQ
jgi:transcriptional regulator with XRE-family HTH domain